jgi:hypothetical protein
LLDVLRAGMANDPGSRPYAEQLRDMLAAVSIASAAAPVSGAPVSGGAVYGSPTSGPPAYGSPSPVSPMPGSPMPSGPLPGSPVSGPPVSGAPVSGAPVPGSPAPGGSGSGERGAVYGRPVGAPQSPAPSAGDGGPGGPQQPGGPHAGGPDQYPPAPQPAPPHVQPPGDNTPTVRTKRRRRRFFGWFLGGLGALMLVGAAIAVPLSLDDDGAGGEPREGVSPTVEARAGPTTSASGPALRGCLIPLPGNGRCPERAECYGPLRLADGVSTAEPVECAGRHTWEAYAVGDLPVGATAEDLPTVRDHRAVRRLCNETVFRSVTLRLDRGWRLAVLPPTADALADGDRTYRCLAGMGDGRLTGPTLAR